MPLEEDSLLDGLGGSKKGALIVTFNVLDPLEESIGKDICIKS